MIINKMSDMKGGWFIGDFDPSVLRTSQFEVCYHIHKKGEKWDVHYHAKSLEINYLIRGQMIIQGVTLNAGDIFSLEPFEIADPQFIEECELIIVKVPSVIGDKIIIKEKTQ